MVQRNDNPQDSDSQLEIPPLNDSLRDQLQSLKSPAERRTMLGLLRDIATLPPQQAAVTLEAAATIAAVSFRSSVEFLSAAPAAARILLPAELRSWAEIGRRITMSEVESGVSFFVAGVDALKDVPTEVLSLVFQVSSRQMLLSTTAAEETLRLAPALAKDLKDSKLLFSAFEIAAEISRRSAKHSIDFLKATPAVADSIRRFEDGAVCEKAIQLVSEFATRAGGIAADAWASLPSAIAGLSGTNAQQLLDDSGEFLERGGGAALQVLISGGEILRALPQVFSEWIKLLWLVSEHGNASLVAFVRISPRFIRAVSEADRARAMELSERVIRLTQDIARVDPEAALACFRSSAIALRTVSIDQFEEWARQGLSAPRGDPRARRSYFALETRGSYEALRSGGGGLSLETVQHMLRLYIEALTGKEIRIEPLAAVPTESRIGDGRTIHLPSLVNEFNEEELDFRLYKVLAAHGAGQIEFGTYDKDTIELRAAYQSLFELYSDREGSARDAFAVADEMIGVDAEVSVNRTDRQIEVDYRSVLSLFPQPALARRIFGTLENGRVDHRLRQTYRGLTRDLDLIREHVKRRRPAIIDLPASVIPFELLFQITMGGGAAEDARNYYRQAVAELEAILNTLLSRPSPTVGDTLMATSQVYSLLNAITQDESIEADTQEELTDAESETSSETLRHERSQQLPQRRDVRELFSAWNDPNAQGEPDELQGSEAWLEGETPEQPLEVGEVAFNYDEWDRELTDHRLGWCRVIEKTVKHGDRNFVEQTRERHKGVISSIRHQFQLLRPENLTRAFNELDGEEFDLNAVIDYLIDRRADGHQSERLYTKRLRRRRDVAVAFLLDQSSSTARTIGRHPLQPYTHPGRRIIEIEKEGLVLMSEALEAVGDVYSISGFTSEGRRNVKFYIVKDFDEHYSDEVKRRIGGITYQNNTRLGAAIRHATARLSKQDARTRLLIVLSDGRPYDHDYGDARYAREDTREALRQAKIEGITPFCITIDRESEAELRDLYGEVGYTIIDDVLSLPERLPGIYRRLTT